MAQKKSRELHDVLVFPPSDGEAERRLFRFGVNREGAERGKYQKEPVELQRTDKNKRRSDSVARASEQKADGIVHGAAFATLPIKPEPGGANGVTCYLLDADNFHSPNFWTVEEWNDGPGGAQYPTPSHPNEFDVLLAGPHGKVFRVSVKDVQAWKADEWQDTRGGKGGLSGTGYATITCINLRYNTAIWQQLRTGCVAGRASVAGNGGEVIPLVNVTALGDSKFECRHDETRDDVQVEEGVA